MGVFSFQRGSRTATTHEALPVSGAGASSPATNKRRWSNLMPFVVAFVVIAEISFLGKLDLANKAALVDSWTELFSPIPMVSGREDLGLAGDDLGLLTCEEWLEREDAVEYSRDFAKEPVLVSGDEKDWKSCSVGCQFGDNSGRKPDAAFGFGHQDGTSSVLRSMESAQYYAENNIDNARRKGYNIVMTTSLSSDVPVGYFSWAEYDIMAPILPKTEKALAAAFISNCGARNFRLQALEALEKTNITIDSYGGCHRNRDGKVDKVQTLKRYKFSLAFENSNEEDYVTEKYFQSLVAGTIPVVVGPPNIEEFSPGPGSILFIKELSDVESVAKTMKKLADNPEAYNQSLRWKYEGPSDSFKALVDMAAVHSSCRLCIHLATMIREKEESSLEFKRRPCKCTRGSGVVYHLYLRERGRFEMESIYIRSSNLTLEAFESLVLTKFQSQKHVPIWKEERPEVLRGGDNFKVYRIYPVGLTQRQALYTFRFKGDADFRSHVESNPCAKFEVIFV
ncbi:PREDICTED: glycoprotein 3-alpha-L-fucosyltransferase A [Fragaria vesca subsp. vesca]|uniref:glycoprotein 3-alpha-L-fucosyltransferase A n=1 Tax=Fragaria vesca subsp. vesca TaxID=101020 RepID=UPI0002C2FC31|nr:PREDICTED: glycoprotein 3-alpha-L-fucosyltransferase A [Fragaria vesca subsp. vesca]